MMPTRFGSGIGESLPPPLPGFSHITRYWDDQHGCIAAKILPGQYYVTRTDELLVTVLGSCVAACIRHPSTGVGGMNHFLLPVDRAPRAAGSWEADGLSAASRYGSHAMEALVNEILKQGGVREELEVKVFGGGRILDNMLDIGRKNIDFVRFYLRQEGLRLAAEDLAGAQPRKVYYIPATGTVYIKRLANLHQHTVFERERAYLDGLASDPVGGEVTLF